VFIYNRWGQAVFHATDPNICWDGKFNGQLLEVGTYYYFYKVNTASCGKIFKKGEVQLIR
jgi:gliding motility-associated-like protein